MGLKYDGFMASDKWSCLRSSLARVALTPSPGTGGGMQGPRPRCLHAAPKAPLWVCRAYGVVLRVHPTILSESNPEA
eukprot:5454802-Amphidinium_carterae.1